MTKRWTEPGQGGRLHAQEARREAERAAATTLADDTRAWFEGVLADRDRQIEARRAEDAQAEAGTLTATAREAIRARRASEDAEWEANSQAFFRARAEWVFLTKAAPAGSEHEVQRERPTEAQKGSLSCRDDPDHSQ